MKYLFKFILIVDQRKRHLEPLAVLHSKKNLLIL